MMIARHTNVNQPIGQQMLRMALGLMVLAAVITLLGGCGGGAAAKNDTFTTSGSREADQRADQVMVRDAQLKGGNEDQKSLDAKLGGGDKTGPNGVTKADEKKTLYDRLGGEAGVKAIVDDFVTRALADPQVNLERKGVKRGGLSIHRGKDMSWDATGQNLETFKKYLTQFISLKTGGPTTYEGPELKAATEDLHFTNIEFDAARGDLKQTMEKLQLPNQEQKELLEIVESTRPQIAQDR